MKHAMAAWILATCGHGPPQRRLSPLLLLLLLLLILAAPVAAAPCANEDEATVCDRAAIECPCETYGLCLRSACAPTEAQRRLGEAQSSILAAAEAVRRGDYRGAIGRYESALSICREVLGDSDPTTAVIFNNLGDALRQQGEHQSALDHFGRAIEIWRMTLGETDVQIGVARNGIGTVLLAQGDLRGALESFQAALPVCRDALGETHPILGTIWNNIGTVHHALGDLGPARDAHERGLAIQRATLGDTNPDVGLSYNHLGSIRRDQGDARTAMELEERALEILRASYGDRHPHVAATYDNLGASHRDLGEYGEALAAYERSLSIRQALLGDSHPDISSVRNVIAEILRTRGEPTRALIEAERALSIARGAYGDSHFAIANILNNIGLILRERGEYGRALEVHCRSLEIAVATVGVRHYLTATTHHNIGTVRALLGDPDAAIEEFRRSLDVFRGLYGDRHPEVALLHNSIGMALFSRGDFIRGEEECRRSLDLCRAVFGDRHPSVALSYNNLALCLHEQRRYDEALELIGRAIDIYRDVHGDTHPDLIMAWNNVALARVGRQEYAAGIEALGRVGEILRLTRGDTHPDVAISANNLGYVEVLRGQPGRAAPHFERARAIWFHAFGDRHPRTALAGCNLGWAILQQGDTAGSLPALRAGIESYRILPAPWDGRAATLRPIPEAVATLYSLSLAESSDTRIPRREALPRALATARVALDLLGRLRTGLSREARQFHEESFKRLPGWVLHLLREIEALGGSSDPDLSLRAAEVASAWSFLEMLAEARADVSAAIPAVLAAEEREILGRIRWLDEHADEDAAGRERTQAEARLDAFVGRLHREFPQYAALRYPRPVDLASLRPVLSPDEVCLEYVVSPHGVFLAAVSRDSFALVEIGSESDVARSVSRVRLAIRRGMRGAIAEPGEGPAVPLSQALPALYGTLLGPVEGLIQGKGLVVVPSGSIEGVSFESLRMPDDRYVAEAHEVSYIPSLAILALLRSSPGEANRSGRLLALGNPVYAGRADTEASRSAERYSDEERSGWVPLPGTGVEVDAISRLFPARERRVLLGAEATEENLLAEDWAGYGYLHFACHGALEEGPGRSPALVLSQIGNDAPEDGFLSLSEVVAHPQRSRLTVLSACNTGRSAAAAPSTGVSSLGRAFLLSGSEAVIVSLWPVSDAATARLMAGLYRGMREERLAPAEALRRAKAELRSDPAFANPLYWAPFVVVGP